MTVEYEGKEYYAETENEQISCKGCAFNKPDVVDYDFCDCNDSDMINDCYNQQIVWKEVSAPMLKKTADEEPKFTVEQVLNAALGYIGVNKLLFSQGEVLDEAVKHIEQELMKQNEFDHKLYLALKAKYENKTW